MKKTYLISTKVLKEQSIINSNVDDSLLHNAIWEAQNIEIQQLLGSQLYNKIIELVDEDEINNSEYADYKYLLDEYIQNVIVYAATQRAAVYIRIKVMNKSVTAQNSENSNPVDLSELQFLMDHVKNDMEFFSKRLQDYLIANSELFPEYKVCNCGSLEPQSHVYRTSLVIPNRRDTHYGYYDVK